MNKTLVGLGAVAIVGATITGIFTATTTKTGLLGLVTVTTTQAPYAYLTLPLAAIGIVLIIVGTVIKE